MRKIPKSFMVMGHEIRVEYVDDLLATHEAWGLCLFSEHKIQLQAPLEDLKVTDSYMLQVFWHEYFHMALHCLGRDEMALDEELVDQLGQVVHQMLKTKSHK